VGKALWEGRENGHFGWGPGSGGSQKGPGAIQPGGNSRGASFPGTFGCQGGGNSFPPEPWGAPRRRSRGFPSTRGLRDFFPPRGFKRAHFRGGGLSSRVRGRENRKGEGELSLGGTRFGLLNRGARRGLHQGPKKGPRVPLDWGLWGTPRERNLFQEGGFHTSRGGIYLFRLGLCLARNGVVWPPGKGEKGGFLRTTGESFKIWGKRPG